VAVGVGGFADAALQRGGDPPQPRRKAWLALGAAALGRGEHDLAAIRYEAAHEIAASADDAIGLGDVLEQLARLELARGRIDDALAHMDRVVALRTAELGEQHPRVADARVNSANVLHDAGRWVEAAVVFRAAATDLERALGPQHVGVAGALAGLGVVERRMRELDAADRDLGRALAIREAALGADHPDVAHTLVALANVDYDREAHAAARERLERALAIYAKHFADDHPRVVAALGNLASVEADTGQLAAAERTYRKVLAVREAKLGVDHPEVAFTLANLGRVLARDGRVAEARTCIERAIAIAQAKLGERHPFLAFARDSLASVDELAKGARR
jgi:tetratricopeptide (TPR) repeat protein